MTTLPILSGAPVVTLWPVGGQMTAVRREPGVVDAGLLVNPVACSSTGHLLGCHNPWLNRTWCVCGQVQVPGEHGTWHQRPVHVGPGRTGDVVGFIRY